MSGLSIWGDTFFDGLIANPIPARASGPKTNVKTTKEGYEVSLVVPGVNKEDININVDKGTMTVSYKKTKETWTSFATRSFTKSWTLPENTDPEFITAKSENGILTLSVPTKDTTVPARTITIQ
tara:strand:- start:83 stop:454 length:372 start_codon:yes stop_codon:yes gene_type:complete